MSLSSKCVCAAAGPGQPCVLDQDQDQPPPVEGRTQVAAVAASDDQGDPEIIKSPSDPKKYRYIELSNGLRALLISDFSQTGGTGGSKNGAERADGEEEGQRDDEGHCGEEEEERRDDEGHCGEEEEERRDDEGHCGEEEEERRDDEGHCGEEEEEGSSEKQAAAALCINVGSFSDPDDLPGLAHFLEHMVFMGSEKYPAENGFDAFLKKHGGSDNASTDCERTIFQFEVQKKYFREALDRWAQFFICPLMIEDAVDREVEAVDSEFQLAKPSDANRKEKLFGSLAKPGHPISKFFWGNAQTLKHEPRQKHINTYERLRLFWRRFYSAHFMTLAVQSAEPLDTLEEWVRHIFIRVPNNGEPPADSAHQQQPFDTPAFNRLYRVVPVRKVHGLTISWALPPQAQHYRVKPLHYISWLIGHEGSGSVLSLLRRRCWALALFGGNSETGFDQNSTYSIFSISITLTDQGYQNFYQVLDVVFQYLKMLQTLGPQQRIYEEMQKIEANEFLYQEQMEPIESVVNICENMQLFPKEDVLTGDQLMFQYDPQVISAALSLLTPDRVNLLLLSPEHEGRCSLTEKWFGTSYSAEDLSAEWVERWAGDFSLDPELHLPAENRFIATDFTLKAADCENSDVPVQVVQVERGALWFKKDDKFQIPRAYIRFHLISPVIQKSPESLVLFDLLVNILAHNLSEPAYEAEVAHLDYRLVAAEHGLVVRLKGFNHKLPLLLKLIVDHLADFGAEPRVFAMFVEQLKKAYFNVLIRPECLGRDVRLMLLQHSRWSVVQKYRAIMSDPTREQLLTFVSALKAELYAEGLVQGNFSSAESKEFLQYFIDTLQFRALPAEVPVSFQVVDLPPKAHLCKVKTLNRGDANSGVTVYYQSGLKNLREHVLMELMVMHMEEPCFDFLRTKETLGYQVYSSCRNTCGLLGFSVTVETQATKFSTELVEQKIEEFLVHFGERLSSLSEEAFRTQVTALIKLKECEDAHLGEEVDRHWFEVVTQQYLFRRLEKEIKALKLFSREDLLSWFLEHRTSSRKLSVHVVGFGGKEDPPEEEGAPGPACSAYGEVSQLTFLPACSPPLQDATLITDIRAFTSSLHLHPHHKILS